MKGYLTAILCCLGLICFMPYAGAEPLLSLDKPTVKKGETGNINLMLSGGDREYAGFNARIIIPEGISVNSVSKGSLLPLDKFTIAHNIESSDDKISLFLLVFSNEDTFGLTDGVLAVINVTADENASFGEKNIIFATDNPNPLVNSKHALSNADGSISVPHTVLNGSVNIIENIIVGDINGDGKLNLEDVNLILKLQTHKSSDDVITQGDVNNNGQIGIEEAVFILKELAEE